MMIIPGEQECFINMKLNQMWTFFVYNISEEQENIEKKAKKTIETATAKCTNIEEKMKVTVVFIHYIRKSYNTHDDVFF